MRSDLFGDQAEGLRRLLVRNQTRVVTVVAGKARVGRTSVAVNLAAALHQAGRDVLVLDENPAPGNLADRMGLTPRFDLLDVVRGQCHGQAAVLQTGEFAVLPTARAMAAMGQLSRAEQQQMEESLTEVSTGMDVMLVDAAMQVTSASDGHVLSTTRGAVSSGLSGDATMLVVTDATASGITESYALIKRLALENARSQFEIVINKADDESAARAVFENMARVARQKLSVRLSYLGCIPRDERVQRAGQLGKAVTAAFPDAGSALAYAALAQRLLQLPVSDIGKDHVRGMLHGLLAQARQRQVPEKLLTM
jgi:flagellar biosynthesis protein FlhG